MSDSAIRELILLAHIFEPGVQNRGYGAGLMMKKVPALLDWDLEKIQAELQEMRDEGLVVPFSAESPNSWKSTPKGRAVRELTARKRYERAQCLCSPADHDIDDLVLALAATPDTCEGEHAYPPTETLLSDYLFDFKDELPASIARLEERKLVNLRLAPGHWNSGKSLYITVDGLREYRKGVVERLGIQVDMCVLDAQPRPVVVNTSLVLRGLDERLVSNLSSRMQEAERCETVQAYLAATVLYGSILEGILEGLAAKNPRKANTSSAAPKGRDAKAKNFAEWKFNEWIAVAREVGWIPRSVGEYADQLRSYRNLIHVSEQLREELDADRHLVKVTRSVLNAVLEHVADASEA